MHRIDKIYNADSRILGFRNSCSFVVSRRRFQIELLSKDFLVFYMCTYIQSLQKDSYAVVFIIALIYRLIESKYIVFRAFILSFDKKI